MNLVRISCTQREGNPTGRKEEEAWLSEPRVWRVGPVMVECAGEERREGVWAEAVTTPESSASSGDGEGARRGVSEEVRDRTTALTTEAWVGEGGHRHDPWLQHSQPVYTWVGDRASAKVSECIVTPVPPCCAARVAFTSTGSRMYLPLPPITVNRES